MLQMLPGTCHLSCVECHLPPDTCHLTHTPTANKKVSIILKKVSFVSCHMSYFMCHLLHVTCRKSPVTCHLILTPTSNQVSGRCHDWFRKSQQFSESVSRCNTSPIFFLKDTATCKSPTKRNKKKRN